MNGKIYQYGPGEKELVFLKVLGVARSSGYLAKSARKRFCNWLKNFGYGGSIYCLPNGFEALGWMNSAMIHYALHWLLENDLVTHEELLTVSTKPELAFELLTGDTKELNRLNRIAMEDAGGDPESVDIRNQLLLPQPDFTTLEHELERFLDYLGFPEEDPQTFQLRLLRQNGAIA